MTEPHIAENRIREFILKQFPLARRKGFHREDKWLETGMLDSLGILDLVHFLEEEFSFAISDDDLQPDNFESLKAVTEFALKKSQIKQ